MDEGGRTSFGNGRLGRGALTGWTSLCRELVAEEYRPVRSLASSGRVVLLDLGLRF